MKLSVNGGAHCLLPGEYEERETDHAGERRSVPPVRLRGDRERIHEHYRALQKQHAARALYVSGVMRWTEMLEKVQRHEEDIIDDFEGMMFAGVDPCRFLRLWYRHLDKGDPELHWSFVTQDLLTGKLIPSYYGPRDRPLFETWQERTNIRYGFTSPLDGGRRRLFKVSHNAPAARQVHVFRECRARLEAMFCTPPVNRDDTCARLEAAGHRILDTREHSISISTHAGVIHLGGAVLP